MPYHSSYHSEIEGQWPWLRFAIAGHHLGWDAVKARKEIANLGKSEHRFFERVAANGVAEYMKILHDAATRGEKENVSIHHKKNQTQSSMVLKSLQNITQPTPMTNCRMENLAQCEKDC